MSCLLKEQQESQILSAGRAKEKVEGHQTRGAGLFCFKKKICVVWCVLLVFDPFFREENLQIMAWESIGGVELERQQKVMVKSGKSGFPSVLLFSTFGSYLGSLGLRFFVKWRNDTHCIGRCEDQTKQGP